MEQLDNLVSKIHNCADCSLYESRLNAVAGYYNPDSPIVIVGTYPNKQDDKSGEVFSPVYRSRALKKCLRAAKIRPSSVNLLYCLKCRVPSKYAKDRSTLLNESLCQCVNHLQTELELLKPKIVILCGYLPFTTVLTPTVLKNIKIPKGMIARGFRNKILDFEKFNGKALAIDTFWREKVIFVSTRSFDVLYNKYKYSIISKRLIKTWESIGNMIETTLNDNVGKEFWEDDTFKDAGININSYIPKCVEYLDYPPASKISLNYDDDYTKKDHWIAREELIRRHRISEALKSDRNKRFQHL